MQENIKLSIIVPVYNTQKYLNKCIESILRQTYQEYELILVDDGSTDDSPAICDHYMCRDERICVIHRDNGGVMKARKAGLALARGEYISFLDSDDWIEPDFYNIFLDNNRIKNVDIILKDGFQMEGLYSKRVRMGLRAGLYYREKIREILADNKMHPALWQKIIKTDLVRKNILLIDDRIWKREDRLCSYACMLDADSVLVQHGYQYHYVQHGSSAMHQYSEKNIVNLYLLARNVKKVMRLKRDNLCEQLWNEIILTELVEIIHKEFVKEKLFIGKVEIKNLQKKFNHLSALELLNGNDYKTVINIIENPSKMVLKLYFWNLFCFLNVFLKLERKLK